MPGTLSINFNTLVRGPGQCFNAVLEDIDKYLFNKVWICMDPQLRISVSDCCADVMC
jgi:hypothetical protein